MRFGLLSFFGSNALQLLGVLLLAGFGFSPAAQAFNVGDKLTQGSQPSSAAPMTYTEIEWNQLLPKDWDPMSTFKKLNLDQIQDGDPRADQVLSQMKTLWAKAPPNRAMASRAVRIPGFAVVLEEARGKVSEMLLVPYFGACIHVPPPPANQLIHVLFNPPVANVEMMAPYWVSGVLTLESGKAKNDMGSYAYRIQATEVKPYQ